MCIPLPSLHADEQKSRLRSSATRRWLATNRILPHRRRCFPWKSRVYTPRFNSIEVRVEEQATPVAQRRCLSDRAFVCNRQGRLPRSMTIPKACSVVKHNLTHLQPGEYVQRMIGTVSLMVLGMPPALENTYNHLENRPEADRYENDRQKHARAVDQLGDPPLEGERPVRQNSYTAGSEKEEPKKESNSPRSSTAVR